jgi:RNA polymerase sigma-70 factor (ECF subfamily)
MADLSWSTLLSPAESALVTTIGRLEGCRLSFVISDARSRRRSTHRVDDVGVVGSDPDLVSRLRAGDESAFVELVERHHGQLIRLAGSFVARAETAEDIAQETWLALLNGIDRFEGRSSLRTWLFQICANRARSIGEREHRTVPTERVEAAVDAEQFTPTGVWTSPPTPWPELARQTSDDAQLVAEVRRAIASLPALQQTVVTLRDVDGLTSKEVCEVLDISDVNQRVLLHRARGRIRRLVATSVASR